MAGLPDFNGLPAPYIGRSYPGGAEPGSGSAMFTLRCDYRENRGGCVITRLRECKAADSALCCELIDEVLTTGDYVIQTGQFVLIIERKTWEDLAASIKDGRIFANHKKMLEAAQAGCRIMYLIEGRAPSPEWSTQKVGGIPVSSMMAKLDHFAMRDNTILDFTRDARHTALRLLELGKHMATLAPPPIEGAGVQMVDAIVKKKHEKPAADVRLEMLMCVAGIGPKTAADLLAHIPFAVLIVAGSPDIGKHAKPAIAAELRELAAGRRQAVYAAMLSKVKGVSDKLASLIASAIPIGQLAAGGPTATEAIASIKSGAPPRRLGDKLAASIVAHIAGAPDAPPKLEGDAAPYPAADGAPPHAS